MEPIFHIGYHKTGTSWLQQSYFREHPGIALLSNSEHPWEDRLLSYLIATSDAEFEPEVAQELLAERIQADATTEQKVLLISAERLSGHPFSGGYDSVRIARRIAASFADAKIVCVVRNQPEMIWSVYKQLVSVGYPGTLRQLTEMRSWKTTSFDLGFFEYDRLISQYHGLFGGENVCVLQYELMRHDVAAFLGRLCSFLEIDFVEPKRATSRVNPSLSDASIGLVRRLNYFRRSDLYPLPLLDLGRSFAPLRQAAIQLARLRQNSVPQRDKRVLREIGPRFSESNARLARLLGDEFTEYQL